MTYGILLWVAVSVIATPLIGALIFRQFRHDPEYLSSDDVAQPSGRNFGQDSGNAARAASAKRPHFVAAQLPKRVRVPGAHACNPGRILH